MVASIEEFADRYHVPKPFIGLILIPIVVSKTSLILIVQSTHSIFFSTTQANAAEHVTSVWMAMKNQMELTITICVGSSIVRSYLLCSEDFSTSIEFLPLANCCLCNSIACHCWLEVSILSSLLWCKSLADISIALVMSSASSLPTSKYCFVFPISPLF